MEKAKIKVLTAGWCGSCKVYKVMLEAMDRVETELVNIDETPSELTDNKMECGGDIMALPCTIINGKGYTGVLPEEKILEIANK